MAHGEVGDILASAGAPVWQDGPLWDNWKVFRYNYVAEPHIAPWGELAAVDNVQVAFFRTDGFINCLVQDDPALFAKGGVVEIPQPIHLLLLSTTNSAHSMSELMSFIRFWRAHGQDYDIGVSSIVMDRLPFLYQFLRLCVPIDSIVILKEDTKYFVRKAWMRRNIHMNMVEAFQNIPFEQRGDLLLFRDLWPTCSMFIEDPTPFNAVAERTASAYAARHQTPKRVMLLKTKADVGATTPGRAMEISPEVKAFVEAAGVKVLGIGDFSGIDEYLATLYGAEVFITSYGGPACTNRFFCNKDARVILLGNLHYKWEYDYPSDGGAWWHIRHSHLFPVREQIVVLDHNNEMTAADAARILRLADGEAA
jgi:hypothetical protein